MVLIVHKWLFLYHITAPDRASIKWDLIECDVFHDVDGVLVEGAAHELEVGEDEGLVDVEA
jgi:hypothetical protein